MDEILHVNTIQTKACSVFKILLHELFAVVVVVVSLLLDFLTSDNVGRTSLRLTVFNWGTLPQSDSYLLTVIHG